MRIERLDILRYRALADVTIPFRPDARLHLVYGPQEAGKSTALEAISDALFGFEQRLNGKDVRFASGDLRLGMRVATETDGPLDFRRRKASADTLLKSDEAGHLPDHVLAPYLQGLERKEFETRFALHTARMRTGAEDLEASGGDAGSALLSASGLSGLGTVLAELEKEADALFSSRRAAHRTFYRLADERDAAAHAEKEAQLTASEWSRLREAIARCHERDGELAARRIERGHEIEKLETLLRIRPIHADIAALTERLADFDDLDAVVEGTAGRLERLGEEHVRADERLSEAVDALARVVDQMAEAEVEHDLVRQADVVRDLAERAGGVERALADLPKRRPELDQRERRLAELAAKLGRPVEQLSSNRPTDAALARLRETADEARAIRAERERLDGAASAARREDEEVSVDPEPLAMRYAALASVLERTADAAERRAEAERRRREVEDEAARLAPPVTDLAATDRWRLPDDAAVEGAGRDIAACDAALAEARREVERLHSSAATLEGEIATDRAARVVTRDQIDAARRERDAALGDPERLPGLIARADELADRALADAEAVALAEKRIAERSDLAGRIERVEDEARAGEARAEAARAKLAGLFRDTDVDGHDAAALLRWKARVDDLRARRREASEAVERLDRELAEREALAEPLRELAIALGAEAGALPVGPLATLVAQELDAARKAWRVRADARVRETTRRQEREALTRREDELRGRLAPLAKTFGLSENAGAVEMDAVLRAWDHVPGALAAREEMAHRVETMERDVAAFEADVREVTRTIDPTLADLPATVAARRMRELCDEAKRVRERHRTLAENERQARRQVDVARRAAEEATERLAAESAAIATNDPADFERALERLRQRDALLAQQVQLRERLADNLRAFDHEGIEHVLDGFDPVEAGVTLERLREEDERLKHDDRALHVELHNLEAERRRREEAGGAEEHAFARNAAAARMSAVGRQWLVLRAARAMLDAGLERARAAEFGPWLERASTIFADLTDRSFERVERDYSTGGAPRMVGIRAGGERVGTDGMSEGTLDQLYLALRLAHLVERGEARGPMPFIGDDIFMTFDRARTRNGLRALAGTADHLQPILFTHHDFVVEEAKAELGGALDLIELRRGA